MAGEQLQFPDSWRNPKMPGYGTFPRPFVTPSANYQNVARGFQSHVERALSLGYRHVDTAFSYGNQDLVGGALNVQGIARATVFVASKLLPDDTYFADATAKIRECLRLIWGNGSRGAVHYLDSFLIHYPGIGDPIGAWRALIEAKKQGMVRHIGVSNFEIRHLEQLESATGVCPEINQIEFHPYLYSQQRDLARYCIDRGIALEAYCPLAEGKVLADSLLSGIAAAHQTSIARVALRWCMQHGLRPVVGTQNPRHMSENARTYDFSLGQEEMSRIDGLSAKKVTRVSVKWNWNPHTAPLGSSRLRSGFHEVRTRLRRLLQRT